MKKLRLLSILIFGITLTLHVSAQTVPLQVAASAAAAHTPAPPDTAGEKTAFDFADFGWVNGQSRQTEFPLSNSFFTASLNLDNYYSYNFARPSDNVQTLSSTVGRSNEFIMNLASVGFEANYKNTIARVILQTGASASLIQDLDGTTNRGANLSISNQKLIREATAGYHFRKLYGINVEAGIFMSFIGLESYMTYENWFYNRCMITDFTPFYFQGVRCIMNLRRDLRLETWLMDGFQTYGKYNNGPSAGLSSTYRPTGNLSMVGNLYYGTDFFTGNILTYGSQPDVRRLHHDHSILYKYAERKGAKGLSRAAWCLTNHIGVQSGNLQTVVSKGGDTLYRGGSIKASDSYVLATALSNRFWFCNNLFTFSQRIEYLNNPGRYLSPVPGAGFPNGQTVEGYKVSTPAGYNPLANNLHVWGITAGFEILPTEFLTFRIEYVHRAADIPYFAGPNGVTPNYKNLNKGETSFTPDLRKTENRISISVNARI